MFQRRTSREGLLCDDQALLGDNRGGGSRTQAQNTVAIVDPSLMAHYNGEGSSDPLLQIPDELSAVLTLKRGVHIRAVSSSSRSSEDRSQINCEEPEHCEEPSHSNSGTPNKRRTPL